MLHFVICCSPSVHSAIESDAPHNVLTNCESHINTYIGIYVLDRIVSICWKMASKRYKCVFSAELASKYPFIKKDSRPSKTNSDVFCGKCNSYFSVANSGARDIEKHIESDKHRKMIAAASTSRTLTSFFASSYDYKTAAMEAAWAYHVVQSDIDSDFWFADSHAPWHFLHELSWSHPYSLALQCSQPFKNSDAECQMSLDVLRQRECLHFHEIKACNSSELNQIKRKMSVRKRYCKINACILDKAVHMFS